MCKYELKKKNTDEKVTGVKKKKKKEITHSPMTNITLSWVFGGLDKKIAKTTNHSMQMSFDYVTK